jgi:hypothetical protein
MRYIFIVILAITITLLPADTGGKRGFSFLKIAVDARAAGMGEAYSSLASDAAAAYWNPAGLAMAYSPSIVFMHNSWLLDINHEFAAVQLFQGKHNIAFSLNTISVGDIELRQTAGSQPDGYSTANNTYFSIAYARSLNDDFSLGIQLKYLYERYYLVSSGGIALDFGVIKRQILPDLNWGFSLQNIGEMSKLRQEATPLPLLVRTGVNYLLPYTLWGDHPLLAMDFFYVFDDVLRISIGTEVTVLSRLNIRLGYLTGSESYSFTSGIGINFGENNFSYAFVPYINDLGQSHRISVLLHF